MDLGQSVTPWHIHPQEIVVEAESTMKSEAAREHNNPKCRIRCRQDDASGVALGSGPATAIHRSQCLLTLPSETWTSRKRGLPLNRQRGK